MSTLFFEDKESIKKIDSLDSFVTNLKEDNIKFKLSSVGSCCDVVTIDNKEKAKHSIGVDYGMGKSKYYFIGSDNTIIYLDNNYAWDGNGVPWATTNKVKILKSDNKEKYLSLLQKDEYDLKIGDFEKQLKEVLGIKINSSKKYLGYEDFAKNKKDLLIKYLEEEMPTGEVASPVFAKCLSGLKKRINKYVVEAENRVNIKTFRAILDVANLEYTLDTTQALEDGVVFFKLAKQ